MTIEGVELEILKHHSISLLTVLIVLIYLIYIKIIIKSYLTLRYCIFQSKITLKKYIIIKKLLVCNKYNFLNVTLIKLLI